MPQQPSSAGLIRVLGLDPGSVHTGWGMVEKRGSSLSHLASGRFSSRRDEPLAARLAFLAAELERVVDQWRPAVVVLESLFHARNVRSLIVLAQARGALLATLARQGLEIREFSPAEVKSAVTGHGRAGKEQVSRMVGLLLATAAHNLPTDTTDALAVAICGAQRLRLDRLRDGV